MVPFIKFVDKHSVTGVKQRNHNRKKNDGGAGKRSHSRQARGHQIWNLDVMRE